MTWSIDYNGYGSTTGDWDTLNIEEYSSVQVMADDGVTHVTNLHTLRGRALINASTDVLYLAALQNARARLNRVGQTLKIFLDDGEASETLVNITDGDEIAGTPKCEMSIVELHGARAASISFVFTWHDLDIISGGSDDESYHVMSHWWTTSTTFDEAGLAVITINGALRVRDDVAGASWTGVERGPNPDRYRDLVMPKEIPVGFRHSATEWVIDPTGTQLAYVITLQEHARNLPSAATRGEGSFSWRYSVDSGAGAAGRKVFDAQLEGDSSANRALLLAALVDAASRRISFNPANPDMIWAMEVTEDDIFSKNIVGLRVEAIGSGSTNTPLGATMIPSEQGATILTPLVDDSVVNLQGAPTYGSRLLAVAKKALYQPATEYTTSTFPRMQHETSSAVPEIVRIYTGSVDQFSATTTPAPNDDGAEETSLIESEIANPYVNVSLSETVTLDSHLRRVSAASLTAPDRVWQDKKPTVTVRSQYMFTRYGRAPQPRFMRPPNNSIITHEEWMVAPSQLDSNHTRIFQAMYVRECELLDVNAGGTPGFTSETNSFPGVGSVTIRRWRPGQMGFPEDPRVSISPAAANRNVFTAAAPEGVIGNAYDVVIADEAFLTASVV